MKKKNIIVIGASAGGFETIKQIVADLSSDLDVAIFIVWHIPPDVKGILPHVLNKFNTLPAHHPFDREPIKMGHIYVAPPDRHLVIEENVIRVTRGPKENRFRPAVDPLFRSAAYSYGTRVIGVILSGALDDGAAGLWYIKSRGGTAIVQDPKEADAPSMPENALRMAAVDHKLRAAEVGPMLIKLSQELIETSNNTGMQDEKNTKIEIGIALQDEALEKGVMDLGTFSPYTCPQCHGVLMQIKEGNYMRFRCHTGHAFSSDTLLASITENIEDSLWSAIRIIEEDILLLNHMGDHFAEENQPKLAAMYFKKAKEAQLRAQMVRKAVLNHEHLSVESIQQQTDETDSNSMEMDKS